MSVSLLHLDQNRAKCYTKKLHKRLINTAEKDPAQSFLQQLRVSVWEVPVLCVPLNRRNCLKIRSYRHPGGSQGPALSGMPGFRFSPE
jgi:hypothetical protein